MQEPRIRRIGIEALEVDVMGTQDKETCRRGNYKETCGRGNYKESK